ncbi:MAG: aminopeptidase P N-terminal domain-containing protein [Ferruginibacter sp.]|nr:aminopeptidase P N-terminal domain-containing protein [Bacteroidota bacterium]MBX2917910.1 aminopeptidase P N-terminal domain-containing protein [Ferruginibacter sp.]MCB0709864.1 aminopeptidase P N-terminal domain-containing protein [Chitinophagaceae bacterium]
MQFRLFQSSVYKNRRTVLKQKITDGLILIMGNDEVGMNYKDNWYPYRQDSCFLYYFGINLAGLAAVIDTESGEETIFGDDLSIDDIVWTGPQPTIAEMAAAVAVTKTAPYKNIETVIRKAITSGRKIHFTPPYRANNRIKIAQWLNIAVRAVHDSASVQLIKAIVSQRSYKEECEIVEMDKAAGISADMHLAAMRYTKPGMKEYEVMAKVKEIAFANNGSLSFHPIVTIHGETLHNVYAGNTIKDGQMVLCDAGAANDMNYAGDLTCTFPAGKNFTQLQKEVYEIVLQAHTSSVAMLQPGVLYKDVYLNAAQKIVEGMQLLGVMKGNATEAVEAGAHAMFFQCGLGHMIGLDVHDMEDLGEPYVGYTDTLKKSTQFGMKSLRLGRALEAGFTLTVEPGVYCIPQLMDSWKAENKFTEFINYDALEQLRKFSGIRVEEDYLITQTGCRLLGKKLPMTVDEVENIRAQALS